jgi:hypothetical protein
MKQKVNGKVECYKMRVVAAKGFSYIEGIDYEKNLALIARYISIECYFG